MKLKNKTKGALTLNLAPCLSPTHPDECFCTSVNTSRMDEAPDGTRGLREMTQRLPGSVTILTGKTSGDLPAWVREVPDVKAGLHAGRLVEVE